MDNPTLRFGSTGDAVEDLEEALIEAEFKVMVDGHFGNHIKEAVEGFQQSQGLKVDGIVGPNTWAKLRTIGR